MGKTLIVRKAEKGKSKKTTQKASARKNSTNKS
jgi:hypothetical protein